MDTGGAHPILVPPLEILTPEALSITKVALEEEVPEEDEEVEVVEVAVEVIRPTLRQLLGSKKPLSSRYVPMFLVVTTILVLDSLSDHHFAYRCIISFRFVFQRFFLKRTGQGW